MASPQEYTRKVRIGNELGFHVRPVQRFAELARIFQAEVDVEINGRTVPGKSVMNLMSLGARHGDEMTITARGQDARQCVEVLTFLAQQDFFVEDNLDTESCAERHIDRLAALASCFDSDIQAKVDSNVVNAKEREALEGIGLFATSRPRFEIEGRDARQARAVLENLAAHCFYIEDEMAERSRKGG